jgi:hypothetical protein
MHLTFRLADKYLSVRILSEKLIESGNKHVRQKIGNKNRKLQKNTFVAYIFSLLK